MPAERIAKRSAAVTTATVVSKTPSSKKKAAAAITLTGTVSSDLKKPLAADDDVGTVHPYPTKAADRANVINRHTGRKVTPFQFQVYDLCAQIPKGQITTYKHISDALQSSSRAVGQALKINPFAPLPIPCHRVLDSKLYIGGFMGQWGEGEKIDNKRAKLYNEGVVFDETDHVVPATREKVIFKDFKAPS